MGVPPQNPYPPSRADWKAQRAQWRNQSQMQRAADRARYLGDSRRSVVGPLLLTLIGVVALLMTTHHINTMGFWLGYGHWWPILLIGAGIVLAIESLVFSKYCRIRLGGGVVLLGILLALLGICAAHKETNWLAIGDQLNLAGDENLWQIFGSKHESSEQIAHPLPPNASIIIQNPRGNITINSDGSSADGQMHLSLEKTVYSDSDSDAERKMQLLEPLITSNGRVITVHMAGNDNEAADITLTLPAAVAAEVRAEHGDVTVNGRQAPVTINAGHGDVHAGDIVGAVHVTMQQGDFSANNIEGDITLGGHMDDVTLSHIQGSAALQGAFLGDVHLENLQGPMHLHSSRTDLQLAQLAGSLSLDGSDLSIDKANGPIFVTTQAKDVVLRHIAGEVKINNSDGDVEVNTLDPLGPVNIVNRNGSVQVTIPANAGFSIDASAADGEIHNSFNLHTESKNDRSIATGSVRGGGPLIHITAEKGDITLR